MSKMIAKYFYLLIAIFFSVIFSASGEITKDSAIYYQQPAENRDPCRTKPSNKMSITHSTICMHNYKHTLYL